MKLAYIFALLTFLASSALAAPVENQSSSDIQLLHAKVTDITLAKPPYRGFISLPCIESDNSACAQKIDDEVAAKYPDIAGRIVGPLRETSCAIAVIDLVAREDALNNSTRVGLYYAGLLSSVPTSHAKQLGRVTLKDGDSGIILRFNAEALCSNGTATASRSAIYDFKPFIEFDNGEKVFRVWENTEPNYILGGEGWRNGGFQELTSEIDRTPEILK